MLIIVSPGTWGVLASAVPSELERQSRARRAAMNISRLLSRGVDPCEITLHSFASSLCMCGAGESQKAKANPGARFSSAKRFLPGDALVCRYNFSSILRDSMARACYC